MIGIYMYENKKNHKKYIGQSINIERRKREHLQKPSNFSDFDQELKRLGEKNFTFVILEECTVSDLDEREKYWIKYYNSIEDGYNLILGGQSYRGEENPGARLTEKQVKDIIKLLKEHHLTNKEIATSFKVHINTIDNINRCKTWSYLHNYKNNIRQESLNLEERPHSSFEGENNPLSKISEKEAIKIIELLKKDKRSLAQISREEKISLNILYDINRCKTWKYLHNYRHNIRQEYQKESDAENEDK